jgi:voltage-gated potassium channel
MKHKEKLFIQVKEKPFYNRFPWQLLISLCTTVLAFYVPLDIVLELDPTNSFHVFYWTITVIFTSDIVFHFLQPIREPVFHTNLKDDRIKYLRTWFIVDLLSAIPFEIIFISPFFGLFRLLKISRVIQFMHIIRQKSVRFSDYLLLAFFFYWLAIIAHWLTCGWMDMGIYTEGMDSTTKYITSLYWVIETLSTVGYGETSPTTNIQYVYAMIIMFFGVGMYGFIIANVANILARRNPARAQYFSNLDQLKTFVNYRNIPVSLQRKIRDYYNYIWKKKLGFDESIFLSGLPQGLQSEVSVYLKREILEKIPLFEGVSNEFLEDVSLHMRPIIYIPGEYVFKERDYGNEMYFVIRGKLTVISGQKEISTLTDGDFFGEIALFSENKKRTASVISEGYSDLYRLDKELFDEVLKQYPQIAAHIKETAQKRIGNNF